MTSDARAEGEKGDEARDIVDEKDEEGEKEELTSCADRGFEQISLDFCIDSSKLIRL